MASFGHIAQGTTLASPMAADVKFSLQVVAPENGTVTAINADLINNGTDIHAFRAGIYNDAPTMSGATLIDDSSIVLLSPGTTRSFVSFSGISALITAGSVYWLTLHSGPTGGNASFYYDDGVGRELIASDSFADSLSTTYGTVTTDTSRSVALYADYTPVTTNIPGLKRVSFGRKYSSGVGAI